VKDIAQYLKKHSDLIELMPSQAVAVQCNYFIKDSVSNWSVALHRDLSIPVQARIDSKKWRNWSEKEGVLYVQPPKAVLQSLLVVRVHLEDNTKENGVLELVAQSHENDAESGLREPACVKRGGVLIMKPLTLHASTKVIKGKRRVLHFVFGSPKLPNGAQWQWSV